MGKGGEKKNAFFLIILNPLTSGDKKVGGERKRRWVDGDSGDMDIRKLCPDSIFSITENTHNDTYQLHDKAHLTSSHVMFSTFMPFQE